MITVSLYRRRRHAAMTPPDAIAHRRMTLVSNAGLPLDCRCAFVLISLLLATRHFHSKYVSFRSRADISR